MFDEFEAFADFAYGEICGEVELFFVGVDVFVVCGLDEVLLPVFEDSDVLVGEDEELFFVAFVVGVFDGRDVEFFC